MAANDKFQTRVNERQILPITGAVAVTPADGSDLTDVTRALWIGGAGNVAVVTLDGSTVTIKGVQAGTLLPIRVSRVKSTGTTATDILALY